MNYQVRDACYESNSSSSHSISVSEKDILDQNFPAENLRLGIIDVKPRKSGYGSQRYRYNSPLGKLGYLLVLANGGSVDLGKSHFKAGEIDVIPLLSRNRGSDHRFCQLISVIKEIYGCELRWLMDYGTAETIWMDEDIVDLEELFADHSKLNRLLRGSESYIDVAHGEDIERLNRFVESDLGIVLESPHAYVTRSLPMWFQLEVLNDQAAYSDSNELRLRGKLRTYNDWGGGEQAFNLFGATAPLDAHIVGFRLGEEGQPALDGSMPSDEDRFELYHDLVHFIHRYNDVEEYPRSTFNWTIAQDLKPNIRGDRDKLNLAPFFIEKTGFQIKVECDAPTLQRVQKWYQERVSRSGARSASPKT